MRQFLVLLGLFIGISSAGSAWAAQYQIDKQHSTVSFKIRHLLSKTQGHFRDFDGRFEFEPGKPETWAVEAEIDAASIDTNVENRDKHLRSADFFDVEKFPKITFVSDKATNATSDSAKIHGVLTMHGVSKPVVLDLEIHGVAEDPWGNVRSAFTASITVDRTDFGLEWNEALETGLLLVGEKVQIIIEVEGKQEK